MMRRCVLLCWLLLPISALAADIGARPWKGGQSIQIVDINGASAGSTLDNKSAYVLVMLGVECPISRRMVPTLNQLAVEADKEGIPFYGVISDAWSSVEDTQSFQKEYQLTFPLIHDPSSQLARTLRPLAKPEAFVTKGDGELVYRGRIDNRFAEIGRLRNFFDQHNLRDAIRAAGREEYPEVTLTKPVGCAYRSWDAFDKEDIPSPTSKPGTPSR